MTNSSAMNDLLIKALKDIIEECPEPKLPYGIRVVEIATKALKDHSSGTHRLDSRPIRFRYWDTFNQSMINIQDIFELFRCYEAAIDGENNPVLMQFTGLFDKNEKMIYEDDIVKTDEDAWIAYVEYSINAFVLFDGRGGFSTEPEWNLCEIIGNTFENPELLTGI